MRARRHPAKRPWVVLPVRGIAAGKRRLAETLDPVQRARLNTHLLRHTLGVLERWLNGLERCICVSACGRTLAMAQRYGARVLREPKPRPGLNRAIRHAMLSAVRSGAERVLVLPTDLPCLSREALDALSSEAAETRLALAPDRAGTGTNALLTRVPAASPLHFGTDSFRLHLQAARVRGWEVFVCRDARLLFDLDTPRDLAAWRNQRGRQRAMV